MLAELFLGQQAEDFVVVRGHGRSSKIPALAAALRDRSEGRPAYLAVCIEPGEGKLARVISAVSLRARVMAVRREMKRAGVLSAKAFAVLPTLSEPSFVYQLGSPAAVYGAAHFRLDAGQGFRVLRWALELVAGCDPAVGAIVIVGVVRT